MLERSSKNDFFLSFKILVNHNGYFDDYILVGASDNFHEVTKIRTEWILGKKISEIVSEYEDDLFGIKEIYYNMIPKTRRKFEKYFDELNRWYLINIFSDNRDFLILFYNDITEIKKVKKSHDIYVQNPGVVFRLDEKWNPFSEKEKLTDI